jgi:HD-GYP domain-containing protein (c-di-GMP phosphodiesterase class II)
MTHSASAFEAANPAMLAAIVETSKTRSIVADQDICDERGTKLLAQGQPVSASLQQRLLDRKLRQPLEACLRAEDGVTNVHLIEHVQQLPSDTPFGALVQRHRNAVLTQLRSLPLHAAVQLLLTAAQTTRPDAFDHAVRGLLLAGAMAASVGATFEHARLAMLGGLLHDLGEMYIDPQYLDPRQALTAQSYRHVVSHAVVGQRLIEQLTDYPAALAVAIGEHHERLDGSGYPARRQHEQITKLGRLLMVVEAVLGLTANFSADDNTTLAQMSLALRMVPGEFDPLWTGFVARIAKPPPDTGAVTAKSREALRQAWAQVHAAEQAAQAIVAAAPAGGSSAQRLALRVQERLGRLQLGFNAIGLWPDAVDHGALDPFELQTALRELRFRLRSIWRDCAWSDGELEATEDPALVALRQQLQGEAAAAG